MSDQMNPSTLLQENLQLRRSLLQLRQTSLRTFQRQKLAFEKQLQGMRKQYEKRITDQRKSHQTKYNKLAKQFDEFKGEVKELVEHKKQRVDGLVARVRELEQEKEEILVMHKEVMRNMAESVADAKEKEGYKEVLKLYSTLLTENAQLRKTRKLDTSIRSQHRKEITNKEEKKEQKKQQKKQQKRSLKNTKRK